MIIDQLLDNSLLTPSEQILANYLLDKNNILANLTSQELGKRSFTSQGTVTRLYKKLGLENYREFINKLLVEREEYFKADNVNNDNPSKRFTSLTDIQQVIFNLYQQTMTRTNLGIDSNVFTRVCNRLLQAKNIDIYGIGISDTVAKQMAFKLQALDLPARYHNGINQIYVQNMKNKASNVSVLITLGGKNIQIIEIANILKQYNIYTVALIGKKEKQLDEKEKELRELCKDYLVFDTSIFVDVDSMISTFSAEYLINMIYAALIYRLKHPYLK